MAERVGRLVVGKRFDESLWDRSFFYKCISEECAAWPAASLIDHGPSVSRGGTGSEDEDIRGLIQVWHLLEGLIGLFVLGLGLLEDPHCDRPA